MKENKINFIKEKELAKKADKLTQEFIEEGYSNNPIKAKMLAFRELKKEIKNKDIL